MWLTIVDCANWVQSRAGPHDDNGSTLWLSLEVVRSDCDSFDNTVQVDVYCVLVGLNWIAICVDLESQVVCARANSGIGKNKVDFAMLLLGSLEKLGQVCPVSDVGLDKVAASV